MMETAAGTTVSRDPIGERVAPRCRRSPIGSRLTERICLLVSLSLPAIGCDLPGKPKEPDEKPHFAAIFQENCAGCHGAKGELGPAPPLNEATFRAGIPEKELLETIRFGRRQTSMPAFAKSKGGALTEDQIQILVCEIKGIPYQVDKKSEHEKKVEEKSDDNATEYKVVRNPEGVAPEWTIPKWGAPGPYPNDSATYLPEGGDVAKVGDKAEGAKVFALACAACHGEKGLGTKGEKRSIGAINNEAFLALISDKALRRMAITGRPDLGMPTPMVPLGSGKASRPLNSREIIDLVALLGHWRTGGK